jgi:hypothetical protein
MTDTKKIKIKNIEILTDLMPTLNELKAVKMPGKVVLKVVKSINALLEQMNGYDELRKKVLDKYAEKADNGEVLTEIVNNTLVYKFSDEETKKKAEEEVMEVMNSEIEVLVYEIYDKEIEEIEGITPEVVARLIKWELIKTTQDV